MPELANRSIALDNIMEARGRRWLCFAAIIITIFFAFIVEFNVELPPSLLYSLSVLALVFLIFKSSSKPAIAIYALAIYIPFSRILVGDFGGNVTALNFTNVLTIIAILGWVINAALTNQRFYTRTSLDIPLLVFMLLGCLSVLRGTFYFGTEYGAMVIIPLKRWLTPMIFFFIAFNAVKTKEEVKNLSIIIMIVTFAVALMAIKDYMDVCNASCLDKARVGGIADQPNVLAAFFVYYMFLFAGFLFVYWRNVKSWCLFLPFLACFRGIQVTFSRGGYIAFAGAALIFIFFRNKILFVLATLLLLFALVNPRFLPDGIRYRMESTFRNRAVFAQSVEDVVDKSSQRRIEAWKGGIEMMKQSPLFGIGYGLFPYLISNYAPVRSMDAHNMYILIGAEMGLPALVTFFVVLIIMLFNTRKLHKMTKDKFFKALALGFLGCLGGVFVANIFGGRLDSQEMSSYFWIISALVMRALYIERRENRGKACRKKTK
ncbi:MAG: O-antigen ligase family protein [Candidatus Omnitrophica bacterium]|nr:O-antigen ligase family protein [Candidatus Omnitrophota bacterium]